MTAPDPSSPTPTEPSTEPSSKPSEGHPRLVINGVPVRPEELGQGLSEAVLRRLDEEAARGRERGVRPEQVELPPRAPWAMGTLFLLVGLGLALWLLWK